MHHLKNTFFLLLILSIGLPNMLYSAQRADFLIIENPAALKIYDNYQQELNSNTKREQLPYAPLQIINKNELMGDQITESIHVRLGKKSDYFIIKDNQGEMLNTIQAGSIKTFKNCLIYNDSIHVKKNSVLKLESAHSSIKLVNGNNLTRFFKYKNRYYVLLSSPDKQYGWLNLPANNSWAILEQKEAPTTTAVFLNMDLRTDILNIFKKVNRLYEQYFDFFNQKTLKNSRPPRWDIQITEESVQADFIPNSLSGNFNSSMAFTQRQLENILISTPYKIVMNQNRIIISNNDKK